jgi:hypothetical protein
VREIVQDFLSQDPHRIENTGPRVDVVVRPVGEHELGRRDRPHVLEFRHIIDSHQTHANLEHLTLDELRDVHAKIGQYLEGLGG